MKRLILLIALLLPLGAMAQQRSFEELSKRYSTEKGCTTIELSEAMLSSMGANEGVERMQVIAVEQASLIEEFRASISEITEGLEVMMSVNSGGESVAIYARSDERKQVVELIVATFEGDTGVLVRICGTNIDISNASALLEEL